MNSSVAEIQMFVLRVKPQEQQNKDFYILGYKQIKALQPVCYLM